MHNCIIVHSWPRQALPIHKPSVKKVSHITGRLFAAATAHAYKQARKQASPGCLADHCLRQRPCTEAEQGLPKQERSTTVCHRNYSNPACSVLGQFQPNTPCTGSRLATYKTPQSRARMFELSQAVVVHSQLCPRATAPQQQPSTADKTMQTLGVCLRTHSARRMSLNPKPLRATTSPNMCLIT